MDKRPQLSAKNQTDLMPTNVSCQRWDTPSFLDAIADCLLIPRCDTMRRIQSACPYLASSRRLGTYAQRGTGMRRTLILSTIVMTLTLLGAASVVVAQSSDEAAVAQAVE